MNNVNSYGDENLSFRQIVLTYLRKIMDLNFRVTTRYTNIGFVKCYKRSVLVLSDVLLPFFDVEMEYAYNKFLDYYDGIMRETTDGKIITNKVGYVIQNMKVCRNLFRELNKLLNRNDYLKSKVYGEDKDELISDEDDRGG